MVSSGEPHVYDRASYRGFIPRDASSRLIRIVDDSSPGCNVTSLIASGCRSGVCWYDSMVEARGIPVRTLISTTLSVYVSNAFQHCHNPSASTHLTTWNFTILKFVIQPRQLTVMVVLQAGVARIMKLIQIKTGRSYALLEG